MGLIARFTDFWNSNGFEIVLIACVVFILLAALFRLGQKGTYSKFFYYPFDDLKMEQKSFKKPKSESTGEIICRQFLEKRFNKPFSKARPDFLRNPVTGNDFNLELDCYNPEMRLALEYNGAQHYKYIPFFHRNKEAFLNQKYRDEMKRTKCKENNITLIEIPYTVKANQLPSYIENSLKKLGY